MKSWIPCFFTSSNLGFGLLCIILTAQGEITWAALCIIGSLLCDAMDGRSARALGVSGDFGKELDSLSDVVSFGTASAFLIYTVALKDLGWIGVIPALFYAACGGLRLARFNLNTTVVHGYFQGMPIPNGGCLFAMFALSGVHIPSPLAAIIVMIVGYLLVSKVHHPDFKGQSADVLHKSALAASIIIGLILMFILGWRLIFCLPFALYIFFGLINTSMNMFAKAK
jgi:CDP-diacylglycerol--serine O-phosphatidyltransferase